MPAPAPAPAPAAGGGAWDGVDHSVVGTRNYIPGWAPPAGARGLGGGRGPFNAPQYPEPQYQIDEVTSDPAADPGLSNANPSTPTSLGDTIGGLLTDNGTPAQEANNPGDPGNPGNAPTSGSLFGSLGFGTMGNIAASPDQYGGYGLEAGYGLSNTGGLFSDTATTNSPGVMGVPGGMVEGAPGDPGEAGVLGGGPSDVSGGGAAAGDGGK
jgi:hypothetical protein